MAKRTSRKRLFALNNSGQPFSASYAGLGAPGAENYSQLREGRLVTNEWTIDLAASTGAESSPGTVNLVLGVSSSVASANILHHDRSNLFLVDNSIHGMITDAELVCVETPAGSNASTDINLAYINFGNLASKSGFSGSVDGTIINAGAQGAPMSTAADLAGTDLDGKYICLTTGAATNGLKGTYTAGKFVIRLYGYVAGNDV